MTLKFQGIHSVGTRIRAYDFSSKAAYVEGTIIEDFSVGSEGQHGYLIKCDRDMHRVSETEYQDAPAYSRVGEEILVPFEVSFLEFDDRVTAV